MTSRRKKFINIRISYYILQILLFTIITLVNIFPFFWGLVTSLKPSREIFEYPPKILFFQYSLEHYIRIIKGGFIGNVLSSGLYSIGAVILGLSMAIIAAYAFERYSFKFKIIYFYIILAGIPLAIGSSSMLIPSYIYMSKLSLIDHWYTLILLYCAYNLPITIWIIRGGIETIPVSIEEAAIIDGASQVYVITRIIPRLSLPAIAAAALFVFIGSWNEFIVSSVMINSQKLRPVQLAIYNYLGYFGREWGPLTAATTFAIIPTLFIFTFLSKLLISGLTMGSVKG